MKPLTFFFEAGSGTECPFQWVPGYVSYPFNGGRFRRAWWLFFAVAWVRMDLHDYNRYITSGNTEWRTPST